MDIEKEKELRLNKHEAQYEYCIENDFQLIQFKSMAHVIKIIEEEKEFCENVPSDFCESKARKTKGLWEYGSLQTREKSFEYIYKGLMTDETKKLYKKTYKEITAIEEIKAMMQKSFDVKIRKRAWKESGDELDIDRLLAGDPEHWQTAQKIQQSNCLKLHIGAGANAGVNEEMFAKVAALSVIGAEIANNIGLTLEVYFVYNIRNLTNANEWFASIVKVKDSQHPIDMGVIAQVGNTGLFRSAIFSSFAFFRGVRSSGLGSTRELPQKIKDKLGIKNYIGCNLEHDQNVLSFTKMFKNLINE